MEIVFELCDCKKKIFKCVTNVEIITFTTASHCVLFAILESLPEVFNTLRKIARVS